MAHPLRILVIEDNHDIADVYCLVLRRRGHDVDAAHSGPDGLAHAARFRPDVVICDIGLPGGVDGFGVAAALRAGPAGRRVRMVAITAYSGLEDRARESGFDNYLVKPVELSQLLSFVESATPKRTIGPESRSRLD